MSGVNYGLVVINCLVAGRGWGSLPGHRESGHQQRGLSQAGLSLPTASLSLSFTLYLTNCPPEDTKIYPQSKIEL